jgi:hypothetical protein
MSFILSLGCWSEECVAKSRVRGNRSVPTRRVVCGKGNEVSFSSITASPSPMCVVATLPQRGQMNSGRNSTRAASGVSSTMHQMRGFGVEGTAL